MDINAIQENTSIVNELVDNSNKIVSNTITNPLFQIPPTDKDKEVKEVLHTPNLSMSYPERKKSNDFIPVKSTGKDIKYDKINELSPPSLETTNDYSYFHPTYTTNLQEAKDAPIHNPGRSIEEDLHNQQSASQALLRTVGNTIGNTATNFFGDIHGWSGTILGFNNEKWFQDKLQREREAGTNYFGEIYTEHPDQVFDFKDPRWYEKFLSNIVSGVVPFALESIAIGGVFGKIGQGIKALAQVGDFRNAYKGASTISKIIDRTAQTGAAVVSSWTEGSQIANMAYHDMYNKAFERRKLIELQKKANGQSYLSDDDIAKLAEEDASAGATTIRWLNTLLITPGNFTTFNSAFKTNKYLNKMRLLEDYKIANSTMKNVGTETFARNLINYKKYLDDLDIVPKYKGLKYKVGYETLQETIEEGILNNAAEYRGRQVSGEDVRISDKIFSLAGLSDALAGAIGGAGQSYIIDSIKSQKIYDEQGNDTGKMETTNRAELRDMTSNLERAVTNSKFDLDEMIRLNTDLKNAKTDTERNLIKQEIFDTYIKRNTLNGTGNNLAIIYSKIANLDNTREFNVTVKDEAGNDVVKKTTEAQQLGYAESINDNEYKTSALNAIKNLNDATQDYKDIMAKYNISDNQQNAEIGEAIFTHGLNIKRYKQAISDIDNEIQKNETTLKDKQFLAGINDNSINLSQSLIEQEALTNHLQTLQTNLAKDLSDIENGKSHEVANRHSFSDGINLVSDLNKQFNDRTLNIIRKIKDIQLNLDKDFKKELDENKDYNKAVKNIAELNKELENKKREVNKKFKET